MLSLVGSRLCGSTFVGFQQKPSRSTGNFKMDAPPKPAVGEEAGLVERKQSGRADDQVMKRLGVIVMSWAIRRRHGVMVLPSGALKMFSTCEV